MPCTNIITENDLLIITESGLELVTEDSICVAVVTITVDGYIQRPMQVSIKMLNWN